MFSMREKSKKVGNTTIVLVKLERKDASSLELVITAFALEMENSNDFLVTGCR